MLWLMPAAALQRIWMSLAHAMTSAPNAIHLRDVHAKGQDSLRCSRCMKPYQEALWTSAERHRHKRFGASVVLPVQMDIASEPSSSDNLSYQCKRWRHELHTSMQYSTTIIPGTLVCKKGKQYEEVVTMEVCLHACSRRVGSNDESSRKCASKSVAPLSPGL